MSDQEHLCVTCLSKDRTLVPLDSLCTIIQDVNLWELKNSEGGVCWECRSIVIKFYKFKMRVRCAQKHSCKYGKAQTLKSLSTLKQTTKYFFDFQYYYNFDPLTHTDTEHKAELKSIKLETEQSIDDFDDGINSASDCKDSTDNVYVDTITTKEVKRARKLQKKKAKPKMNKKSEEEVREKFEEIVFTEEEMLRNREEKRNQPNFKKIPYKCDSCVLGFTRKETYDLHIEKKHNLNIGHHTCPVCAIRFINTKSMERHKRKHYMTYRCRLCKYETIELWSAHNHCRVKHRNDTRDRIHCAQCRLVAKTPEDLAEHIRTEHTLYCNECGEKFKGKNTLRTHKTRIHAVKREFICDLCNKTFMTKTRLESHMVTHNATIAKKLAYCSVCRVQYKNIYVYRNHLKNSANHSERAYPCSECNKKFASKVYWTKHYNFYHLQKSQYNCEICNKLFISDWRLKNHKQKHHGLSRSRDHSCNVCGKNFFTLSTLRGHQLTHSEQRSYMCEDCGDTFKQRPALYTHSRLVHRGGKRRK